MPLNEQQQAAVEATELQVLVAAGAGTGKTQVLAERVARLLEQGVSASAILCMTFTRRAAAEMAQRVAELSGFHAGEDLWIGTVHSIAYRMLLEYGHKVGYGKTISLYGPRDTEFLVSTVLRDLGAKFSTVKAMEALRQSRINDPELRRVADEYRRRLVVSQAIDYDRLMETVVVLLKHDDVADAYFTRFRHVLVDEAQDLAPAAWKILDLLRPEHVFLVGDDAQHIYGWSGADIEQFFRCVKEQYKVYLLERNYRSTTHIVALANTILGKNVRQLKKTLATEKAGLPVEIAAFESDETEATFIAKTIRSLVQEGEAEYRQVAILCRTNGLVQSICEELTRFHVPVQMVAATDPFETETGWLLADMLRLSVNPDDEFAARRVLAAAQTEPKHLAWIEVERHKRGASIFAMARELPVSSPPWACMVLAEGAGPLGGDVGKAIDFLIAGLRRIPGMARFLPAMTVLPLTRTVAAWQRAGGTNAKEFLLFLATRQAIDLYEPTQDAVAVLTIHSAKGLEWPVVFVPGWEEGMLPHHASMRSPAEMEEERRVAHVAVSRAADRLYCTWARRRRIWQREFVRVRSKLLDEG